MTQPPGDDIGPARVLFDAEWAPDGVWLAVRAAETGGELVPVGVLLVNPEVYVWLRALLSVGEEVLADEIEVRWSVDEYCESLLAATESTARPIDASSLD